MAGRPPKYASAEVLEDAITKYFTKCLKDNKFPNKAGLCVALDITRDTYSEYRKVFSDTIKRADHFIEDVWVQRLTELSPAGAIFYLKNAFKEHYKDRHETDITSGGKPIPSLLSNVIGHNSDSENSGA